MSGFENRLQSYSSTQLHELLEDDDKLRRMVREMEEMQDMQQNKELTIASNRSLAEQNLSLQPEMDHQKIQLTKRYCCLQDLHESYQLRRSTLGSSSLDTLLALLQTEGAKIEEETENMADSFLDGSLPLDSFIDDYQSKRKLAHLRAVNITFLLLPLHLLLRECRLPPLRNLSRERLNLHGPPQTRPPPYLLRRTSARRLSSRTLDQTCDPDGPRPQRWLWCCSTCRPTFEL
uniref:Vacuolar protein sorting-associated protein 37B-like n=1 Tax=Sinocyclocheilus rhinocerous TaxID=307959 RepID=A0A673M7A6_9TELE